MHFRSNRKNIHKIQQLTQIASHSLSTTPQKKIKEKQKLHLIQLVNI